MNIPGASKYTDALFRGATWLLLAASVGLLAYVVLLRGQMPAAYQDIGNAIQLTASAVAAGAAAWSYFRRGPDMLLAHGAFAGATWTLANAFWYAFFILIGSGLNYPTLADLGFAGVFLFLIAGFQEGLPRNRLPAWAAAPIALPLLAAGLWLVAVLGPNAKTLTTFVMFALSAALLSSGLLRSVYRHPVLLAATVVCVLAHLMNSLDSTLPDPPWVTNAAGALAAITFSLFAIAFLQYTGGKVE
ncbi:MAG: hypothetical protein ABFC89_06940 [Methanospirillum sp.]